MKAFKTKNSNIVISCNNKIINIDKNTEKNLLPW